MFVWSDVCQAPPEGRLRCEIRRQSNESSCDFPVAQKLQSSSVDVLIITSEAFLQTCLTNPSAENKSTSLNDGSSQEKVKKHSYDLKCWLQSSCLHYYRLSTWYETKEISRLDSVKSTRVQVNFFRSCAASDNECLHVKRLKISKKVFSFHEASSLLRCLIQ